MSDTALHGPGDEIFVYDGGPGLVTRQLGWALSVVEMAFGDGPQATRDRRVVVFLDGDGRLDISRYASPLDAVKESWHLVAPDGRIVCGGPRGDRGSMTRAELKELRDSGEFASLTGSTAVFGIPEGARHAPVTEPAGQDDQAFTAARGGWYVWCDADGYRRSA